MPVDHWFLLAIHYALVQGLRQFQEREVRYPLTLFTHIKNFWCFDSDKAVQDCNYAKPLFSPLECQNLLPCFGVIILNTKVTTEETTITKVACAEAIGQVICSKEQWQQHRKQERWTSMTLKPHPKGWAFCYASTYLGLDPQQRKEDKLTERSAAAAQTHSHHLQSRTAAVSCRKHPQHTDVTQTFFFWKKGKDSHTIVHKFVWNTFVSFPKRQIAPNIWKSLNHAMPTSEGQTQHQSYKNPREIAENMRRPAHLSLNASDLAQNWALQEAATKCLHRTRTDTNTRIACFQSFVLRHLYTLSLRPCPQSRDIGVRGRHDWSLTQKLPIDSLCKHITGNVVCWTNSIDDASSIAGQSNL